MTILTILFYQIYQKITTQTRTARRFTPGRCLSTSRSLRRARMLQPQAVALHRSPDPTQPTQAAVLWTSQTGSRKICRLSDVNGTTGIFRCLTQSNRRLQPWLLIEPKSVTRAKLRERESSAERRRFAYSAQRRLILLPSTEIPRCFRDSSPSAARFFPEESPVLAQSISVFSRLRSRELATSLLCLTP